MTDRDETRTPIEAESSANFSFSESEILPLVPEGKYVLRYMSWETRDYFGQPKVIVHFAIAEGENAGTPIERFYNVAALFGSPKKYGRFKPCGPRSHLIRELRRLIGDSCSTVDLSFSMLEGKRILAEVKTVTSDSQKEILQRSSHYSRVGKLIQILYTISLLCSRDQTRGGKVRLG